MENVRNVNLLSFQFDGDKNVHMELARVKFWKEIYKRNDENSAGNYLFIILILNMALIRNFEVIYLSAIPVSQFYADLC